MKRYSSVAALRSHLAEALDTVEKGGAVEVTRRGRTFRIVEIVPQAPSTRKAPRAFFEIDPELLEKGWTWDYQPGRSPELVVGEATPPRRRSGK